MSASRPLREDLAAADLAQVDQGDTGEKPAKAARAHGIDKSH